MLEVRVRKDLANRPGGAKEPLARVGQDKHDE